MLKNYVSSAKVNLGYAYSKTPFFKISSLKKGSTDVGL